MKESKWMPWEARGNGWILDKSLSEGMDGIGWDGN